MNRSDPGDEHDDVRSTVAVPRARGAADPRAAAPVEDSELVARVRDGDSAALEAIYARYGKPCYALARRVLADDDLAQDVVQEVYLALWRDAGRFDASRGVFASWLLSMTHHKAVDVVRREENLRKRRAAADAEMAVAPPVVQPDAEAWTAVRRDRVREALTRLPFAQREALGLAYYGGYTQREIAGLTGTPLGTVKTRTLAGMRKLRELLEVAVDESPLRGSGELA